MLRLRVVSALGVPLLLACGLAAQAPALLPTGLPAARPADFRVVVTTSGGMVPRSSNVECGPTECVVRVMENGVSQERRGPVSATDLDVLYGVVREHRFDRIVYETHGVVYDAGGTNVLVTAGGETWSFGASATESVAAISQADFTAVIDATGALVERLGLRIVPPGK